MKVLHVLPSLDASLAGGPVEAITQLCQELKNQGIEVAIATTIIDDKKNLNIPDVNIHYFHRRFNSFLPLQFAFSLEFKNWLRKHIKEFDLLHIHYLFTYPSGIACHYANKYKIPYILRPTGMLSQFCLKKSAFKKKLYIQFFEKRYLENASAIHFTSREEMNSAIKLRLNNQRIIVPLGLNLERFKNIESSRGIFRKHYPQANEKKIVLFLSRIDPKKGLDVLIPALRTLSKKRSDFVFVLAGSGYKNYDRRIRQTLTNAGLIESTIFTGFTEGKMKFALLADADVFVLSSYDENFGMAVIEAMAAGLTVIISNRVNIYNLIEKYQAGIVTHLDSQDISLALDKLLSDDYLRFKMGVNGKRLVKENFDVKKTAKETLDVYCKIKSDVR